MKRIISVMCIGALLLTGCGNSNANSDSSSSEITLASNQTLLIGKVTAISGNEVTFDIATEKQMSGGMGGMNQGNENSSSDANTENSDKSAPSDMPNGAQGGDANGGGTPPDMAGGSAPGGSPPDGNDGSNSNGGFQGGNMNRGDKNFSGSDASSGKQNKTDGSSESNSQTRKRNRVTYETTGESKTLQIPVGTTVTTLLGTKTTFNRIGASNVIKMVMEKDKDGKDVVVAVYIVQ